jgi:predicted HD phosphohydrolase
VGAVETVSFTRMADGTAADYDLLDRYAEEYTQALPDRLLVALRALEHSFAGYQVNRLQHSLQSASRALRDGRSEEYVVAALLHDLGDELAPWTHGEMAAAILKPFVAPEIVWAVKHHGLFQQRYFANLSDAERNARDRFRDHEWFDACADFCERYDQNCFDPAYEPLPLETFEPMLRRVVAEPRYLAP